MHVYCDSLYSRLYNSLFHYQISTNPLHVLETTTSSFVQLAFFLKVTHPRCIGERTIRTSPTRARRRFISTLLQPHAISSNPLPTRLQEKRIEVRLPSDVSSCNRVFIVSFMLLKSSTDASLHTCDASLQINTSPVKHVLLAGMHCSNRAVS